MATVRKFLVRVIITIVIVSRARRPSVRRALSQSDSREPAIYHVLREGFNCGWIEAELVKIAIDHVEPAGAWGARFQPNESGSKSRIAREGWCGGKRNTCPYQRTRRRAAKEEAGGCPARARTVLLETRSRQRMSRMNLRALLSKPSSLERGFQ